MQSGVEKLPSRNDVDRADVHRRPHPLQQGRARPVRRVIRLQGDPVLADIVGVTVQTPSWAGQDAGGRRIPRRGCKLPKVAHPYRSLIML